MTKPSRCTFEEVLVIHGRVRFGPPRICFLSELHIKDMSWHTYIYTDIYTDIYSILLYLRNIEQNKHFIGSYKIYIDQIPAANHWPPLENLAPSGGALTEDCRMGASSSHGPAAWLERKTRI